MMAVEIEMNDETDVCPTFPFSIVTLVTYPSPSK